MRKLLLLILSLLLLAGCSTQNGDQEDQRNKSYEHTSFTSSITIEDCVICGDNSEHMLSWYMGEENVALVDVNTFDFCYIEINRYHPDGTQIMKPAGYMKMAGGKIGAHQISGMVDPDIGMARLNGTLSGDPIDASAIESFLCQNCLDEFTSYYFEHDNVYSLAIFNFATKTLRPLVETCPWYAADHYSVDCHYEDDGEIDLTIYYCPPRFSEY